MQAMLTKFAAHGYGCGPKFALRFAAASRD